MSTTVAPLEERLDYTKTLSSGTKTTILLGVFLGMFLAALDQTIVATALPAIVAEFRGIDLLTWVSTGYLLASTASPSFLPVLEMALVGHPIAPAF